MMFDVHIMTTWEAIRSFLTKEKKMLYEYNKTESYLNINLQNDISIQNFLDNDGRNYVKRLSRDVCDFFGLEYEDGYYVDIWNDEYSEWRGN